MRTPRYYGSKDHNHDEIADTFRAAGCSVTDTERAGITGWPDMVVGCAGVNHLVEVKNRKTAYGRAGLNPDQTVFNRDWRGEKVHEVATVDEAISLVQRWRGVYRHG